MMITTGQVATNSSSATVIVAAANVNTIYVGHGQSQRNVVLTNIDGSNDVYLGGAGVTSGTGWKLTHGSSITLNLAQSDVVYAIASASTPTVTFLETNT